MTTTHEELFKSFHGRDADLRRVTRYSLFDIMYYRSDLAIHSHRVSWIIRELNPLAIKAFGSQYDPEKAIIMGLVHDDAEIIMGDYQAGNKNKMTEDQLAQLDQLEIEAIEELSRRFPDQVGPYSYRQLLQESFDHSSLESQVLQYADKFDALGEALHEIYAGNTQWMTEVVNEYGRIDLPTVGYPKYFRNFTQKFPAMTPLLALESEWFHPIEQTDLKTIVLESHPHTVDSITKSKGYLPYDLWREVNLKYASSERLKRLHTIVEPTRSA